MATATATKTQPQSIEHLYNKFMLAYSSKRPINHNEQDTLAALAATADLAKDKMIVTRGFKSGATMYQAGDVYPAAPGDRAQVIKLCRTGYILPSEEYQRGQAYGAAKAQAEKIKNLYQALQTARDNKLRTARQVDAARLDLAAAEGGHNDAAQYLAKIEGEILQAFN